ncbi:MAG TPA: AgmX/PglI C-terminal domain-containing protein [Gammaproteobacteria bacterium]|nr:AgmX/PglI C-terminal domain-containing protein [Gammaproteobacteria bacterium]
MSRAAVMTHWVLPYRSYELPWTANAEQERSFRKTFTITLVAAFVLALILSFLPTPPPAPAAKTEIPERFAKLVLEEPKPPPPPPIVREEPKPEPPKAEEPKPEPPKPPPERAAETPPKKAPEPTPAEKTQRARERASTAGLLPFAQQLAALRDNAAVERLDDKKLGAAVEPAAAAAVAERSVITSRVGRGSNGINTAALSRNTGGTGLAARETTRVENPIADEVGAAEGGGAAGGAAGAAARSREEIERIFDKNKGAIYALYNRALRQNPTLQGKVVLRLTIAPDGRVTACEIVSSELGDRDLEQKLVQRVMLFRFEAKDVGTVTTTKPIDFFPA